MNRPLFLTRTQRVLPVVRQVLVLVVVLGLFVSLGLVIGHWATS
jgi:hypothetical protein